MGRRYDRDGNKKPMGYEMRFDTIEGGSVYLIFDKAGNLMTTSTKGNYGGHGQDFSADMLQTCFGRVQILPDFYKNMEK